MSHSVHRRHFLGTALTTGLAVGLAPGAAVAGVVIDEAGASPAYLVCLVGGVLVLVGALLIRVGPRPDSVPPHEHNPEQTDRADRAELA